MSFDIPPYKIPLDNKPYKWEELPHEAQLDFCMNSQLPVYSFYLDDTKTFNDFRHLWEGPNLAAAIDAVKRGEPINNSFCSYDTHSVTDLIHALNKYPLENKDVLVIGSQKPWIEIVCVAKGAKTVTTVDFNPPQSGDSRIKVIGIHELDTHPVKQWDAIFSFSSLEHDGLGRYGDPMHPWGDLERMKRIATMLRPHTGAAGGLLFLGVPMGPDQLWYNAHRIYGPLRFPMLISSYTMLDIFHSDFKTLQDIYAAKKGGAGLQPWVVLKPS